MGAPVRGLQRWRGRLRAELLPDAASVETRFLVSVTDMGHRAPLASHGALRRRDLTLAEHAAQRLTDTA
ncbi:MAG: hypothetical protein KF724_07275 [Phycisphaeraceae bacterium]|nr:hypothetical protein [Phycisphaeraceae bacterium]